MFASKKPERITLKGSFITLRPLTFEMVKDLWEETGKDDKIWEYLFSGPFKTKKNFQYGFKK